MRVPVYPDDLFPKRGFNRLVKKLQRKWIGPTPLTLSAAREILAKGLGYRDYHDLKHSSETCQLGEVLPTEAEVRLGIVEAIKMNVYFGERIIKDDGDLLRFVSFLPLTVLVAFKPFRVGETSKTLQVAIGHKNLKITMNCITVPIGGCTSNSSHRETLAVTKFFECGTCGPYVFPSKFEP
ncbi:hypothetical protein [Pseudomonas sp. PDM08]|uniref:hypothetical protein n=1 Tax=Pseudomonas sp. PDM08 TaxID=2769265 RepID=UPI0017810BCE|nr:hypothetical protein [Pseudomonas sp. PDM08]MBD9609814.1 hypothetical protein [Pseudomonas sp. PDM08]